MKKIQCEVCGSVEIRKMSDDVFVCQHCGVQYRPEDMSKLLVEIKEILENIEETVSAKQPVQQPREEEKSQWDNCFVLEQKIPSQENVKHFLSYLDKAENIACDIYKEISVEQTREFYLPFYLVKGQYRIDWSAIACHTYYEPVTVYENRYNTTLHRMVKEPVTKQVERIQRTPRNGVQNCACSSFVPASGEIKGTFAGISEAEKTQLFEAFRSQQDYKMSDGYKLLPFDKSKLWQEGEQFRYGDWEILNAMESGIAEDAREGLRDHAKRIVRNSSKDGLNGGYFENYTQSQSVLSESLSFVYVPVQVITYRYKDQTYVAVSDLATTSRTVPAIYPCDQDLTMTQEQMEQKNAKAAAMSWLTKLSLTAMVLELIAFVYMAITDNQSWSAISMLIAAMCVTLVAITAGLIWDAKRRKSNRREQNSVFVDIYVPRKLALIKSKEAFFADYPNAGNFANGFPKLGACTRALFRSVPLDYFEENTASDQKLGEIQQLNEEIWKLEKKRTLPLILMTVFGILIIPLFVGSILLGNVNNKLIRKRNLLQQLQDEFLQP